MKNKGIKCASIMCNDRVVDPYTKYCRACLMMKVDELKERLMMVNELDEDKTIREVDKMYRRKNICGCSIQILGNRKYFWTTIERGGL